MARQLQIDLDQHALHSYGLSAQDVVNALAAQNLVTPVGTEKIGKFEYIVDLNDSPRRIESFNALPIKIVNGGVVYLRDIAFAHDGNPPQTNVVQLDGRKGVLMTVLKAGSASTLDIIAGVKKLLPKIEASLPPGVNIKLVGDQSSFVKSAVADVIREGLMAAMLTGLMILLFLGSWRSTLIITISIPLAVLASLTVLSAIGRDDQCDDARRPRARRRHSGRRRDGHHRKHQLAPGAWQAGARRHSRRRADRSSRRRPSRFFASASPSCRCSALAGLRGFLFRPLAEAVVFAMIASYVLSRTLVPTMAQLSFEAASCGASTWRRAG